MTTKTWNKIVAQVQEAKAQLEKFCSDKSVPLQERWEAWLEAPKCLKNTTQWIHHFEAFADLAEGQFKINEFERGVVYEHSNRGEHIDIGEWDEWLLGIAEGSDDEDSEYEGWENSEGKKFTMKHYDAWREEVLAGNIGFVNFDW